MHEVGAMRGVVAAVLDAMVRAGGSRVTGVELVLGASGHMSEESARQYFELFTAGTPAEHASVEVSLLPATYQCFTCLHRFQSSKPSHDVTCPLCAEVALEIDHQDVCYARSIDVAFDDPGRDQERPLEGDVILLVAP